MALSSSPRKLVIPLASGDDSRPRASSSYATKTRRAFYAGVVVEGSNSSLPTEIQDLVLSLGNLLPEEPSSLHTTQSNPSISEIDKAVQRKRALLDPTTLSSVINELVTSERTYVKRLQILRIDYADPLRGFAKNKETCILQAYEAKTLFGNIDNLLPVNEAFLTDLEKMIGPNGANVVGGVGDVCLRHFKELRGFEQYRQYYVKREDAQAIFEKEMSKRSSTFSHFLEDKQHVKYQSCDIRNRVGLRELLMEPVQRIPRYTLLFATMLKHMSADDPQRAKLEEAKEIASKIAQAEADEQTKRAAIFHCFNNTVEDFPAALHSSTRKYIDCIDVEDIVTESSSGISSSNATLSSLHCTLFLFEDKLLIVKRPSGKCGMALSGLDNVEKQAKVGALTNLKKKNWTMSYKGLVEITDMVATDVGGAEFNLFLENPPMDLTDRWNGRPFRQLAVVHPPSPINQDPLKTQTDKERFLNNLWQTQAVYRTRAGQSVVLVPDDWQEVENRNNRVTVAKTWFNVYQRNMYLQEAKKSKVVVHIDKDYSFSADPIPLGIGAPPFVVIRVHLMEGGLSRFSVRSSDPNDEGEEEIVQTPRVPQRITQTIHQFGLFEFKTGRTSMPTTPTARSKVAIFGLDAISRGLFNGDFFIGSINGHKRNRSRSTTSRSSMYTQTTATVDSIKTSHRSSASITTAATSISSMDDDASMFGSRSSFQSKRSGRAKSRGASPSDSERSAFNRNSVSMSRPQSRTSAYGIETGLSDNEEEAYESLRDTGGIRTSDMELAMRLEVARQNSLQHGHSRMVPIQLEAPSQETIYEETSPYSQRNGDASSRRSLVCKSEYSSTSVVESPPMTARPLSVHSVSDRRLFGPRSHSPLPTSKTQESYTQDIWEDEEPVASSSSQLPVTPAIKRSLRQPLFYSQHEATPTPRNRPSGIPLPAPIEPLSIKKKTSIRNNSLMDNNTSPHAVRKARSSPLSKSINRVVSPRRVSPTFVRKSKLSMSTASRESVRKNEELDHLRSLAVSTKEDIENCRRTLKELKTHMDTLKLAPQTLGDIDLSRSLTPERSGRSTPQPLYPPPLTKESELRQIEMRNAIGRRHGEFARNRPRSGTLDTPTRNNTMTDGGTFVRTVEARIAETEKTLNSAESHANTLQVELARFASTSTLRDVEYERIKLELLNVKRQFTLVRKLLNDANTEKEIMYSAFNDELDTMYNDLNLTSQDDAIAAFIADIKKAKKARQELQMENSILKDDLATMDLRNQQLTDLLIHYGIPVPEYDIQYDDE